MDEENLKADLSTLSNLYELLQTVKKNFLPEVEKPAPSAKPVVDSNFGIAMTVQEPHPPSVYAEEEDDEHNSQDASGDEDELELHDVPPNWLVDEDDDTVNDATFCPHRDVWHRNAYQADIVIQNVIKSLATPLGDLKDIVNRSAHLISLGAQRADLGHLYAALNTARLNMERIVMKPLAHVLRVLRCRASGECQDEGVDAFELGQQTHMPLWPEAPDANSTRLTDPLTVKVVQNLIRNVGLTIEMLESLVMQYCDTEMLASENKDVNDQVDMNDSTTPSSLSASLLTYYRPPLNGAPLVGLPTELLIRIFLLAKQDDRNNPFTIAAVNQRLRGIVLTTPFLWDSLDVADGTSRATLHATRSKTVPLDVSISLPPSRTLKDGETWTINFIKSFGEDIASRARSLQAVNVRALWTAPTLNLLQTRTWPRLEYLDVGITNTKDETLEMDAFDALGNLRELAVRRVKIRWPVTVPRFQRLTKLEVSGCMAPSYAEFLRVVSQMKALQHLALIDVVGLDARVPRVDPPNGPVVLPDLSTLEFLETGATEIRDLFAHVEPPNLKRLSFKSILQQMVDPVERELQRIIRLHPTIVDFEWKDLLAEDWPRMFKHLPSVKYLRISHSDMKDEDLRTLMPLGDEEVLCPNLTHLTLDENFDITSAAVKDVILSRTSTASRAIESLTWRTWDADNANDEDLALIREHVEYFYLGVCDELGSGVEDGSSDEEGWDDASFTSGDEQVLGGGLRYDA